MHYTGWILAALAVWILLRCARSMLSPVLPEVWAQLAPTKGEKLDVTRWECVIGRSPRADAVVDDPAAEPFHAVLRLSLIHI